MSEGLRAELQNAGDFDLDGALLIGSSGESINVKDMVMEINIYQSLDTPFMSGNILIGDAGGVYEGLPILGQERLVFKLKTPGSQNSVDFNEYHAQVYNVERRFPSSDRKHVYLLNFVTLEAYKNIRTKVSKSFKGTITTIVQEIMQDTELLGTNKPLNLDITKNVRKFVSPNLRPFRIIEFLREEAVSKTGEPCFLFYENPDGFHFRSLDSLLGELKTQSMAHKITYKSEPPEDPKDLDAAMATIQHIEVEDSSNTFTNGRAGMFASTLYHHDIFNKTLNKYEFDYLKDGYSKRNHTDQGFRSGPIISETKVDDKNTITEFPESRIFVHSSAGAELYNEGTSLASLTPYTDNNADEWLQEAWSRDLEKDFFTIKLDVWGNTDIMIGDIIDLIIPSNSMKSQGEKEPQDPILSGRYLITKLHHQVNINEQMHTMTISAMKDSVMRAVPKKAIRYPREKKGMSDLGLLKSKRRNRIKVRSLTANVGVKG